MVIRWGETWTVCWVKKKLEISFQIVWMTAATTSDWAFHDAKHICQQILVVLKNGPLKVQKQHQHHFAGRTHTSEFVGSGQWHVFPLHSLMVACRFIVVNPHFIAYDNPLQESLSFFTILLQKLQAQFHPCPLLLICKLFWHPPNTNFVIPEFLVGDRTRRFTADVQLVSYISDSNPLSSWIRTLNRSTLSAMCEVVRWPEQSSSAMLVLPLQNLSTHWYTFLCITVFSILC